MRARADEGSYTLVLFTVCTQTAAGLTLAAVVFPIVNAAGVATRLALGLLLLGAMAAFVHLGRPSRARFVGANVAGSWLSREVVAGIVFGGALLAHVVTDSRALGISAAVVGLAFVYVISRIYRLRTVPAWDTWATPAAFLGTTLVLGAAFYAVVLARSGEPALVRGLALFAAMVAMLELVVFFLHLGRLDRLGGTATASARTVRAEYRPLFIARVGAAIAGSALLLTLGGAGTGRFHAVAFVIAVVLLLAAELTARRLFYASHRRVGL